MLSSWFQKDPAEASKVLHTTMRAQDFEAETSARMARRTFRTLDARLKDSSIGIRQRGVLVQEKRELEAKELVCANTARLLHKMYHSADITLVTLQATVAAQALSNACIDVRSCDGSTLKNSIAVARQLERADQLLDAIDTITSREDVDEEEDPLISCAPAPPRGQ